MATNSDDHDEDDSQEFSALATKAANGDHRLGGVAQWCVDARDDGHVDLVLQTLPISLAGIRGRPLFRRDSTPGIEVTRFPIQTTVISAGPMKGPLPTLFAPDPGEAASTIALNKQTAWTGMPKKFYIPK